MLKTTVTIAGVEHDELLPEIKDETDVLRWFAALTEAGMNFHPEDRFSEMVNYETGEATLSEEDAKLLDRKMDEAYAEIGEDGDVCEVALMAMYAREARIAMEKEPTRMFSEQEIAEAAFGEFSEEEGRGRKAVEKIIVGIQLTTDYKPQGTVGVGYRLKGGN